MDSTDRQHRCQRSIRTDTSARLSTARTLVPGLPALLDVRRDNKREKLLQYGQRVRGIDSGSEAQRVDAAIAAALAFFESLGNQTRLSVYRWASRRSRQSSASPARTA